MKISFLFSAILYCSISFAQQVKFEKEIGWESNSFDGQVSLNSFYNKGRSLICVTLKSSDSLLAFLFNEKMQLDKITAFNTLPEEEYFGGFIKDNKIAFFLKNTIKKQIHSRVYDIANDSFKEFFMPFDMKGKKFLGQMGLGNFYCLAAEKKEPVLNIFEFTIDGQILKQEYDLANPGESVHFNRNEFWQSLSKQDGLSRETDIAIVKTETDCSVDVANSPNKLYMRGDTLLLLMDNQSGQTKIFSFDLSNKKMTYRTIERNGLTISNSGSASSCVFNSFLLENNLYYIYANENSIVLAVSDFSTGKELNRYTANRDDNISFKNTAISQDGGGTLYSMNAQRELEKTKQLLRKLLAGRAVVSAYRNHAQQHEITIGAYKELRSSGGGWMQTGGAPIYMGGVNSSWKRATRFKSLFNAQTAEHISGEMQPSITDKIDEYTKKIKIPAGGEDLLAVDNIFYYAYYDREFKTIVILKL